MTFQWVHLTNIKGIKGDIGTWFQRNLTGSDVLEDLTVPGAYGVLSGATATALGLPVAAVGSFEFIPVGVSKVWRFTTSPPDEQVWERTKYANGTVWGEWRRTDFRKEQPEGLRPGASAGMKVAPQAVSLGHGGAQVTGSGFARGLIRLAPTVKRVRVHIANRNPRYALADDAAVALAAVTIGIHAGDGAQNTVQTIATGASTGTSGYTSPWVDADAYAGKDVLVGYDYSSAGTIQSNIGTGYGATGTTGAAGAGTATKLQALPLFVWVEVEVPSSTPVIAAYGDSLSCGVGSSNVVYDSPVSQYARTIDGVPVHFAASGDSMASWDAAASKWAMYGDMPSLADAVIFGMGSNDVFGGATLSDLQGRYAVVMGSIRHRISPNVYGATIMPRTGVTGAAETVRRDYNTWLKARPDLRKVFDFAASISTDDETITPAYDADGTHLTTSGYTQNANTLTGVVDVRLARAVALAPTSVVTEGAFVESWADASGQVALGIRPGGTIAADITTPGFDLILIIGQSNAVGAGRPIISPTHPRIFQVPAVTKAGYGTIIPAVEPLQHHGIITSNVGVGPGMELARQYAAENPHRKVLLVPAAQSQTGFTTTVETGGTGCWQLNKVNEPINLAQRAIDQTVAALAAAGGTVGGSKIVAVLWVQGEADGALTQAQYETYQDELFAGIRSQLGIADLPIVIGQMNPERTDGSSTAQTIDKAHMGTPARITRTGFAYGPRGANNVAGDTTHYSSRGAVLLGRAMYDSYKRALRNDFTLGAPQLEDLTATRRADVVTVKWSLPWGTVTSYLIEWSNDAGATWVTTGITRYSGMDTKATIAVTGADILVRVTAQNSIANSTPQTVTV